MIRKLLKTILIESENANNPDSVKILGEIFVQKLPEVLEKISNSSSENRYDAEGSIGTPGINAKDKLGYLPNVYLYDTFNDNDQLKIAKYYLIYILREDRKGLYISLNHSQTYMKKILEEKNLWDSWFSGKLQESLINEIKLIREKIGEIPENFSETMNLGSLHAKSGKMYEAASVYSKYYTLDNLPSEEELINDFKILLNIYNDITAPEPQKQIWKIAPGDYQKRHEYWPTLKEKGYIGIGYFNCKKLSHTDLSIFNSFEELRDEYKKCTNTNNVGNTPSMIWNFVNEVKIGDWVVANDGLQGVWGIGIIESDYIPPQESELKDDYFFHFRKVKWLITDPIKIEEKNFFSQQTVTKIIQSKWKTIKSDYISQFPEYENIFDNPNQNLELKQKKWILITGDPENWEELENSEETTWSGHPDMKRGDIVLMYNTSPRSQIEHIFQAKYNSYDDHYFKEHWNAPALDMYHKRSLENPIAFSKLKNNDLLSQWRPIKINFTGRVFEIPEEEWLEIKKLIISENPKLEDSIEELENPPQKPIHVIKELFKEYETGYCTTEEGIEHTLKYDLERKKVQKYFDIIKNNPKSIYDVNDPPINHLLPIKEPAIAPAAVGDIRAYKYKDEDLPNLTKAVYNLVENLMETKDEDAQNGLIENFKSGPYKNGFRTAIFTPVLYYLNSDFLLINKKTVSTFNFISEILYDNNKISVELVDYINNNSELKKLLNTLKNYIPDLTFEKFDEFCHWMCDESLGNYANDRGKYQAWLLSHFPPVIDFNDLNIQKSLEIILNYYNFAKEGNLPSESQIKFENLLKETLPNLLQQLSSNKYSIYSTGTRWNHIPFVALKDDNISIRVTEGFYVNYIFTEDMSGVYLSLRQGVRSIVESNRKAEAISILKENSEKLRKKLRSLDHDFHDSIGLNGVKGKYAPYYEAGTIICKFYDANNLPDDDELKSDLKNILDLYNTLAENEFLKFLKENYQKEINIGLNELERGKNLIFYGPPGSGKTVMSKIISEEYLGLKSYSLYTVHSGTDYYDLVCRIVPEVKDGNLIYSKEKRFLLDALLSEKVLILDEINRTQIDTALGIFFTYLEREHRLNDAEHIRQILLKEADEDLDINDLRNLLDKFRIIGTLNVYDKTFLFKLGDALKRRFTFIEITTKNDLIEELKASKRNEFLESFGYKGDSETADIIIDVFGELNKIKPLGIGILKDALLFTSYFSENSADLAISSLIVPFFENDLNYSNIRTILERHDLNNSLSKLNSLNFGTSDMNGI